MQRTFVSVLDAGGAECVKKVWRSEKMCPQALLDQYRHDHDRQEDCNQTVGIAGNIPLVHDVLPFKTLDERGGGEVYRGLCRLGSSGAALLAGTAGAAT